MIVLSIDTCGASGSVALGRVEPESISVFGDSELPGKTYSAQLVPEVRGLLTAHGTGVSDLDAIVVVNGPGSFTGIRVGVSSAKGYAEALNLPIVAVSRLAVLAWKAQAGRAALDAGRNELYYFENGLENRLENGRAGNRESLVGAVDLPMSSGLAVCEPSLHWRFPDAMLVAAPTAADALRFAAPLLLAREFADIATLDGNYVRRSDAEVFSKAKEKASAGKP